VAHFIVGSRCTVPLGSARVLVAGDHFFFTETMPKQDDCRASFCVRNPRRAPRPACQV
jgi:hypothetical protein